MKEQETAPKSTLLDTLVTWFETSEDATTDSRKLSERDADYYDGKQLTAAEYTILAKRKQPPVINNRIKPKIDYMLGQELKTRTDPKAFPRNPQVDEDGANAATDALRFVCDATKFERVRSLCYEDGLKYGTYGSQAVVTAKKKEFTIDVKHVPWDRLFYDSHSRTKDFSDAKYKGIVLWMDRTDAINKFPNKEGVINNNGENSTSTDTYGDIPKNRWTDGKRDRVRVCYIEWKEKDEWQFAYFTKGGFLTEAKPIPFVNDEGESIPSLEFQSLFVDRDGNRYGQVRQYIDMQDEINKRRSKGLHLLNTRQVVAEKGAVDNVQKAREELAKPDGYVETTPGMLFQVQPTSDMAAGNFNMLQEAKSEIDAQGPNAAMVGAEKRDLSGRAIQALQSGGNTETSIQIDGLRDWEHRVYRQIWYCIKKYWTYAKWIRVTDDESAPKYVGLNIPTTAGEQFAKQLQKEGQPVEQELIDAIPEAQTPEIMNNIAELDVDIILEDVPDTVTIQQEQFEQLTQLFPAMPEPLKPLAFEMLIEASTLRNKRKFVDKLNGKGEQQGPNPQITQIQQQMDAQIQQMQAEMQKLAAENEQLKSGKEEKAAELMLNQENNQNQMAIEAEKVATNVKIKEMELQTQVAIEQLKLQSQMEIEALKIKSQQEVSKPKEETEPRDKEEKPDHSGMMMPALMAMMQKMEARGNKQVQMTLPSGKTASATIYEDAE